MKRKGLRRALAIWVDDSVPPDMKKVEGLINQLNVNREVLRNYGIRDTTKIDRNDLVVALQLLHYDRIAAMTKHAWHDTTPREQRFEKHLDDMHKKGWIG